MIAWLIVDGKCIPLLGHHLVFVVLSVAVCSKPWLELTQQCLLELFVDHLLALHAAYVGVLEPLVTLPHHGHVAYAPFVQCRSGGEIFDIVQVHVLGLFNVQH